MVTHELRKLLIIVIIFFFNLNFLGGKEDVSNILTENLYIIVFYYPCNSSLSYIAHYKSIKKKQIKSKRKKILVKIIKIY